MRIPALAVLLLAAPAAAQYPMTFRHPYVDPDHAPRPHYQRLERMAEACDPAVCFDGAPILRREGAYAVLSETKLKEWKEPAHEDYSSCSGDGRGPFCPRFVPAKRFKLVHQEVGIADRERHVRDGREDGMKTGAVVGILPGVLIGFILNPFLGLAALGASMLAGATLGKKGAENDPRRFERRMLYEENDR